VLDGGIPPQRGEWDLIQPSPITLTSCFIVAVVLYALQSEC